MDSNQISGLGLGFWDLENIHMKAYRETTYSIRINFKSKFMGLSTAIYSRETTYFGF